MFNTIQLVKSSKTPLYLQLANGLARFIENGQLPPATKLPSIRSLAKELKINRDTVVSAYKVLENKKLAYGQTGRGTYVSPLPPRQAISPPTSEPFSLNHKDLINFSSSFFKNDYCPIEVLEEITSQMLLTKQWACFYDYDGGNYKDLLGEVCNYFRSHSLSCTPKQIRISESISQLIGALPRLKNKAGICIESPCKDISIFKEYGFEPFEVPLTSDGMDLEILETHLKTGKIQYIFLTPYLQNPTGICYASENKEALLTLAKAYHVYIIENESYGDLLLTGIPYAPIYSRSPGNHVIYISHFSQLYLPHLHYSFVILPHSLAHINLVPHPYNLTDTILYHFLHHNMWQKSKALLIKDYQQKYLLLCNLIDSYLASYFSYDEGYGGIYVWLTLKPGPLTVEDLSNRLLARHVLVSPGSLFYSSKNPPSSIRLSIGNLSLAKIEKGVKIIASILSSHEFE